MARKRMGKKLFTIRGKKTDIEVGLRPLSLEKAEGIAIGTASGLLAGLVNPALIPFGVAGGVGGLYGFKALTKKRKRKKKR